MTKIIFVLTFDNSTTFFGKKLDASNSAVSPCTLLCFTHNHQDVANLRIFARGLVTGAGRRLIIGAGPMAFTVFSYVFSR